MTTVSITGAGGNLAQEIIQCLLQDKTLFLRLHCHNSKRGRRTARKLRRRCGQRAEILFGDVCDPEDCRKICEGADYLIHMAAVVPPRADHDAAATLKTNRDGTLNLLRAMEEAGGRGKLIYFSSVAVYGHRDLQHPWGRVGDPLVTSAFDMYGQSKTMAEFAIMESALPSWVILRLSAVLYDNILVSNISDGLIFHTPWNALIEWVTTKETASLLSAVIRRDREGLTEGFWKRVYNVGGGSDSRQTGYETFEDGFKLIGASTKKFFRPEWTLERNFHCFWFSDSDELEERFHFRCQSCRDFWRWYARRHWFYRAGALVPSSLLRRLVLEPLLKNNNAPAYWAEHGDGARLQAFYGGREAYKSRPREWKDVKLFCESPDYERIRSDPDYRRLDHGYDENKPDSDLSLEDMQQAAKFRGGACLSESEEPGGLYQKLIWQCHEGHIFTATPYTVLKAGHWCPACCQIPCEWHTDRVARRSPFHAQVWLDTHDPDEEFVYALKDGKASMRG